MNEAEVVRDCHKRHPQYFKYDRSNMAKPDFEALSERLCFDQVSEWLDPTMEMLWEFRTRNDRGRVCYWIVEEYKTFYRVTGPIPEDELEETEASFGH